MSLNNSSIYRTATRFKQLFIGPFQFKSDPTDLGTRADRVALTVKGAPSQSANLAEFKNSSDTVLSAIDSTGRFTGAIPATVLQYLKVTLTAAQVKALNGTPISLIAAPGAGLVINLYDAIAYVAFATTQYTAGSTFQLKQGTIVVATTTAALINAAASAIAIQLAFPGFSTSQSNGAANTALTVTASGTEFATGDSPVDLHLWYSVVTG